MAEITTDQWYPNVTLTFPKPDGSPGEVQGVPVWASSDETVLAAQPGPDGLTGAIQTIAPGTARITFTADADLGDGVKTITGVTDDINVTMGPSSQASTIVVSLGDPVDKTPVVTPV